MPFVFDEVIVVCCLLFMLFCLFVFELLFYWCVFDVACMLTVFCDVAFVIVLLLLLELLFVCLCCLFVRPSVFDV